MSETKHTPWPWVADDNEGFSMWKIYSRMSPSGSGVQWQCVAEVIGDSAVADANALLIAAAPELLESLERCFDIMNNGGTWSLEDQAAARAAIAKAKGEQP